MKKITALLLMILFLLGTTGLATAASASGSGAEGTGGSDNQSSYSQNQGEVQHKPQTAKDLHDKFQPQTARIRNNRTETLALRLEARETYTAALQHIKTLKEDPDNLSDQQLNTLRQALRELKQNRLELCDTLGDVDNETLKLRTAYREQNMEQMQACLDNVTSIQEARMELLRKCIKNMESILEI